MDVDLIARHIEDSIVEWQVENKKPYNNPPKYIIANWMKQFLEQTHTYFAIDKRLSELFMFTEFGYEKLTERRFNSFVDQVYSRLNLHYQLADGKNLYERLINSSLLEDDQISKINYYPALIPLADGIYSTITWDRMDYSADILFTRRFNVCYSASSDCPEFRKFMNRILPNRDSQLKVFSYLCYCMTPEVKLQISQIWTGGGKNGKTELTNLLDLIMGDLVTHIPMDAFMSGNAFVSSELAQAWLNIGSELTPSSFKDKGITQLKRNITNKTLRSEKKYDSGVNYKNKAKHLNDVNELPMANAYTDYAFFRRYQIIQFTEWISEEEREYDIIDRIFKEEGPQIVRFILSFHDVMHEYLQEDAEEAERLWRWNGQSVFVFFEEFCTMDSQTPCDEVYEQYLQFCKHNNKQQVSKHHFGRLIKVKGVNRYREPDGDRSYVYGMEVNYDQADDIIRNAKIKEQKQLFLKDQEVIINEN